MKKKLPLIAFFALLAFGLFEAFEFYKYNKEKKRRASFYENLVDTSSPTVTVLRDSILIAYQNERRTIHIYVPPNYEVDSSMNFPVIYMLDGESSFSDLENMAPEWEIDEVINSAHNEGKQTAIVVGVNQAENRDAEYTPFVNEDNPNAHGADFADWLANDLKKWVDTHYRTKKDPASTTIGGISRSGMMAYYILMAHPDVFSNAIIQSPSMWVDYERLMAMNLSDEQIVGKKVFISVGEDEGGNMVPFAKDVFSKFQALGMSNRNLKLEVIPNEGHWHITWRKSFALAFPWLMK